MTKTVGILQKGEVYPLIPEYSNELNVCINCEQDEGKPCVPQFHDKREGKRNFEYVK